MHDALPRQIFPAGAQIFTEGEAANFAYVIEAGNVEMRSSRGGRKVVLARLGEGELLGEAALVGDNHRAATAVAVEETQVVQYFTDMAEIERLAGALFAEQLRHSTDPVLRSIFETFVVDEQRHARAAERLALHFDTRKLQRYRPSPSLVRFRPRFLAALRYVSAEVANAYIVAGELLLGPYTPFAAANYAIGITAVLPTNSAARSLSGITARDMLRTTTLGELDQVALAALEPTVVALARYEGLPSHAAAVEARSSPFA